MAMEPIHASPAMHIFAVNFMSMRIALSMISRGLYQPEISASSRSPPNKTTNDTEFALD
jgi:hypothetical protein